MKAQPIRLESGGYIPCEAGDATHVRLNVPGPYPNRIIPVILKGTRDGTGCWSWNGDVDAPTLKPSVLTRGGDGMPTCHSFVNNGRIQFLGDCTHDFVGQTLDLLEVEE